MERLQAIHNSSQIRYGSFREELVEQTMVSLFLPSDATVLELGSNIGRNSIVISKLLDDSTRLVTLEMDPVFAAKCIENRDLNGLSFHVECKALSYRPLFFQKKPHGAGGGFCVDVQHNADYLPCATVTLEELEATYGMEFDTLVADCEGGLFSILHDHPSLLDRIQRVFLENDFCCMHHKEAVNRVLENQGFHRVFFQALPGSNNFPCKEFFWETWVKQSIPAL